MTEAPRCRACHRPLKSQDSRKQRRCGLCVTGRVTGVPMFGPAAARESKTPTLNASARQSEASAARSAMMKARWADPTYRRRLSEAHKARWADPEFAARRHGELHAPAVQARAHAKIRRRARERAVRAKQRVAARRRWSALTAAERAAFTAPARAAQAAQRAARGEGRVVDRQVRKEEEKHATV